MYTSKIHSRSDLNKVESDLQQIKLLNDYLRSSNYTQFRIHILREIHEQTRTLADNETMTAYTGGCIKLLYQGNGNFTIASTQSEFWGLDVTSFLDSDGMTCANQEFSQTYGKNKFSRINPEGSDETIELDLEDPSKHKRMRLENSRPD